jgi:bifunctional DNA-binding transcriptional regulator/antitoxin component of YhaV-PrlF toxin-antitoxin module
MTQLTIELPTDGTFTLPAEIAQSMGWQAGEKLIVQVQDGKLIVFSQTQAIQRAQEWVKSFVPGDRSLSQELIAERRLEAQGE